MDIDEERLSYVQTRFAGWIQDVFANATYQYVRKGQRLFTIYSPDLVSTEQEYLLATQNQNAFSQDAHGMAAQESGWLLQAAEERLRQFGVPAAGDRGPGADRQVQRDIAIDSPASGYIIERNALPNAYVQPDTKLYTIADLSTVWVYANVFQNDVGRLKPGDPAQVTVDAYPGRHFNGRIDQILPQVDPTTRTVRVRLVFRNPGVVLKPGMYVNVAIAVPLGRQLVIPASAVLQSGSRAIAFIDHGNGNLEPRAIEIGPQIDDSVDRSQGTQARRAGCQLRQLPGGLRGAVAGGAWEPLHPRCRSRQRIGKRRIRCADPDRLEHRSPPPRKGANTVRVKLTGADGKPVDGRAGVGDLLHAGDAGDGDGRHSALQPRSTDKGNGVYEGSVQLQAGGTWQVTVTVQRGGKTVATKQLSLTATGGM